MLKTLGSLAALVAWLVGSAVAPLAAAEEEKKPLLVIEAEAFELTDAKVEEMKGANGGKVVVFANEKSKAVTTVTLPKGWMKHPKTDSKPSVLRDVWVRSPPPVLVAGKGFTSL